MEISVKTIAEFEAEAARFVCSLAPSDASLPAGRQGAVLVTLSGDLGAGKTAFVKAVARALGVEETVNSPTFVLEKIYQLSGGQPFKRLIHIDAYRLERRSDLAPLGFDELMQNTSNLILLEWPEKVEDALPVPAMKISLIAHDDGSRTISYG